MDHGVCRACGLLFLQVVDGCPQCGSTVEARNLAACIRDEQNEDSPVPTVSGRLDATRPVSWEIAYECRNQFEAITLQAELERNGILSWVRSLEVGGYPGIVFNETIWGWLLVDRDDLDTARETIVRFFDQMNLGEESKPGLRPPARRSEFSGEREE